MKNKKALNWLLVANAVSGFAQGISMIAIPWYLVDQLDMSKFYNILFMSVTGASLLWNPVAGSFIDRYPRKSIFLILCLIGALVLGATAITGFTTGETYLVGIVVVFAFTVLNFNIHYPALYAFGQELTESSNYARTNSLLEIQGQATRMLSGAVAAILLSGINSYTLKGIGMTIPESLHMKPWSISDIFALDAGTYVLSFLIILGIRYTPIEKGEIHRGSVLRRLRLGFQFLQNNLLVLYFGALTYAVFITLLVHNYYLAFLYVSKHLGKDAHVIAGVQVGYTAGALTAGFFITRIFRKLNKVAAILTLMMITILILLIAGFTRDSMIFIGVSLIFGLTNSGVRILRVTWLFERIPNNVIGRSTSVFNIVNIGFRVLFLALFGMPFFVEDITRPYLIMAIFVGICSLPLFYHYRYLKGLKIPE